VVIGQRWGRYLAALKDKYGDHVSLIYGFVAAEFFWEHGVDVFVFNLLVTLSMKSTKCAILAEIPVLINRKQVDLDDAVC